MKTCPFCAEEIQDAAIVCKHCGRDLDVQAARPTPVTPREVLQRAIPGALQQLGQDWRVETQNDSGVIFVRPGAAPNHVLHFVLTLLTLGLWLFVWFFVAAMGKDPDKRQTLIVDAQGELSWYDDRSQKSVPRRSLGQALLAVVLVVGIASFGLWLVFAAASLFSSTPPPQLDYTWENRAGRMSVMNTSRHTLSGAILVVNDRWECVVGTLKMAETRRFALEACRTADGRLFDPDTEPVERTMLRARIDGGREQSVSKPRRGTQAP